MYELRQCIFIMSILQIDLNTNKLPGLLINAMELMYYSYFTTIYIPTVEQGKVISESVLILIWKVMEIVILL